MIFKMNYKNCQKQLPILRRGWGGMEIVLLLLMLIFPTCKDPESLYSEYLVPNGRSYPARALDAGAHPGNERIEITWLNGTDRKVTNARIFWNNYTDSVEIAIRPGDDTIRKIINPIAEDNYSFMIKTYDAKGNVSVPVEVIGAVYGEKYRNSLMNRILKNAVYNGTEASLQLEWYNADATEVGTELEYTDTHLTKQKMRILPSETTTLISDFSVAEVFYQTFFKPDSAAIDVFYAPRKQISYYGDITASSGLKNTQIPFTYGDFVYHQMCLINDWKHNQEAINNGNVDRRTNRLCFFACNLYGLSTPSHTITNGKLYQTVELEAGTYRFDVYCGEIDRDANSPVLDVYICAALGNDLPDVAERSKALDYASVPDKGMFSINFNLSKRETVSLGFIANIVGSGQIYGFKGFDKVELWKKF